MTRGLKITDSLLSRWQCSLSLLLLLTATGGCGGGAVVPVSGRVTLGGQPLAGAVVTFQPVRGNSTEPLDVAGSVGQTDSDGRFELRLIEPDKAGAAVGKHRVTISTATSDPDNDAQLPTGERVPPAWRDGSQTFEVPPDGTTAADFNIP